MKAPSPFGTDEGNDRLHVLWENGERVFCRLRDDVGSDRYAFMLAPSAAEPPAPERIDRLTHEYELRHYLDSAWALRPVELVVERGRTMMFVEYAEGERLDTLIGTSPDIGRFLRLALGLSTAVARLHASRLVHKDIKPSNVLVDADTGRVWLTGFGIASRLPRERQPPEHPEFIAGTLAYMAPEQTGRMNRTIDSRSDLYALGVTFYEMLTGVLPFSASEPMEWVHCHIARQPIPPENHVKEIPAPLSAIVLKLLAKAAEERYQTAAGVARDLRHCLFEWEAHHAIDQFPLGTHDVPDRLLIPETLYGRRREVETLLASFDRVVSGGAPELVLVSGYSGIGKSSVVNELQPVLVPPRGLFASGKFDQYKRDIPYATLAQAFQSLIRPLLGKSEADLAPWRDTLREALGPNAGLIVDLVPEVKLIIGEQPAVPELPPQEAQRRFQMVLRRLIGIFARPEHPLALFLDDLQWLDSATLDLLEDVLSRSDLRNLLLIGAYRDNEVTTAHPLMRKLEVIRATGRVQDIKLGPMTTRDLEELVADSLRCNAKQAVPLARLVHAKTDGNPFFVIQFLHLLVEEGLVAFDHERLRWSWNLDGIHAKRHTDNVVELLAGKLTRLPLGTRDALQQLACLGNLADVAMLSIVLQVPEEQVHAALWEALRQQLIERLESSYRFIHDRIHEAGYALIPEEARAEVHLKIGRLLAAQTPPEKRDERIFEIVNQLNRGTPLITSHNEREQLAELNLAAGKRAKASSAYASALVYLTAGAALLPWDVWERRQDLAFELELHAADCEVHAGALPAAEERLAALAARAVGAVQRCVVAHRRVNLYVMLAAGERAITVALECLRSVGIDWPTHPTEAEAREEYERFRSRLGNRPIEHLADLPLMQDAEALATLDLLTNLVFPASYTDVNLFTLAVCKVANLSLERGNSDASPVNYPAMGLIAGARFGHYDEGYRLGKLGCDLLERRALNHFGGRTYSLFAALVPWTRPLKEAIDPVHRSLQIAKDHGDLAFVAYAVRDASYILLASGHSLDRVEREAEQGLEHVRRVGFFLDRISATLALVRMLRGKTAKFGSLDDDYFTERLFEERAAAQPIVSLEYHYWIRKLQARLFAGDYASAIDALEKVETCRRASASLSLFMLLGAEYHFYTALCLAARCSPLGPDRYDKHREALGRHQRQLREWAAICPANFEDRAALVSAEIARIEGRPLDAMDLYERAIASARASGFVHHEALAYELAARFNAARGFEEIAHLYLGNARRCYLRWGADGKVRQLDQLHPWLRHDERTPSPASTIETPIEQLDLATVIEVSQALSGEMVVEKLVDRFMRAAIEQAGAERALLVAVRGEELRTSAEAVVRGAEVNVQVRRHPAQDALALPDSIIRYSMRARDPVILDDAMSQTPFSTDPYIVKYHVRSVLCLPLINQGKLIGILYLENNLTPHVFTPARVAVLKVLASQAAISLENTRLYAELTAENTERRRTDEALRREMLERERAEQLARMDEMRFRRFFELPLIGMGVTSPERRFLEVNEKLCQILGYSREELIGCDWASITHPDDLSDNLTLLDQAMAGATQSYSMDKRYIQRDGQVVHASISVCCVRRADGAADHFVLTVQDVTARYQVQEQLQLTEAHLTHAQQIARIASYVAYPPDFYSTGWSEDFRHMCGLKPGAPVPSREEFIERFVHPDDREYMRKAFQTRGTADRRTMVEYRMLRPDGEVRYLQSVADTVKDKSGRIVQLVGTILDVTERKRAEEALSESQQRYERVMLAADAGFWDWDVANDEFYVSPRLLEMAGFPAGTTFAGREDFMGRAPFYPEDREKWQQAVREIFASGGSRVAMDVRLVLGRATVWNRLDGMCFRDAAGRVVRWTGSATDVTDRKQAEDALRESQERYAVAVEGAADGIWDWDLVTGMLYRAPRNQQMTMGRPSDGIDTRHVDEWSQWFQLHPDDAPKREEAIRLNLEGRTPFYEIDYRVRHQDGTYHWVHARGVCTRDPSGRPVRFAGSTSDIDARKAAEEALRASEERYSLAVAGSNEGIFDWDLISDRVYVSTRAQELFGVPPGEPWRPRKEWRNILNFHPDDRVRQHDAIKALIEGSQSLYDEEFRIIFPDASVRWFGQRGIALRDASGKAFRMVGSIGDITDRKMAQEELLRLERQLRQAQRLEAMGTLAGGIAHDFNNILGAIIGYGEMALRGAKKDTRLWRDLDAIMSAGERGRALVDRILAFSRSGTGERVPVHVEEVVREVLDQLAAKLPENVTIAPRLRAGRAAMLGDSTQVHQVVMNLTNNAVQAMPDGGVLRVTLETERVDVARAATLGAVEPGDCIVLKVSDSGTGIAPEVLERMFDPFFTTKEVGVGSGLGLSLVHGIVTNVGGAIDVTTELSKGSTFMVYFPRCGDAPEMAVDDMLPLPRGEGQRVLVVEDEESLLRLATETLEELGYIPSGFTSSIAALAAFRADPHGFDAVLTDERMPGISGSALIREVRGIRSAIPVVLMSGYLGMQSDDADVVVRKPLLARELATSMARALRP